MAFALKRVYLWCLTRKVHEFTRQEIKYLLVNESDSARFGDWVMFGGLVYKKGKGHYGLNMERCEAFFRGRYQIPTTIIKDPATGGLEKTDYRTLDAIPSLASLLNRSGEYEPQYQL